jgi:drug/metabolite transporter (DMT)-like permease
MRPSTARTPSHGALTIAIAILMAIWAINFIVVKIGLRYLPSLAFASYRIVGASIFMVALAPLCARLPMFRNQPPGKDAALSAATTDSGASLSARNSSLQDYWTYFYLGFFGVAVNQFCFTLGLRYTNVTHSSIIVGMAPIYTLTLAVLLRLEKATVHKIIGLAIAFTGVVILALSTGLARHSATFLGDAITICGSLGFAMYVVLGKRVAHKYDSLTMTTWNFLFGGLLLLPIAIQQSIATDMAHNWRNIPWQAWACVVYTGLLSSTLAYLLYFWLLRYLEASQLASFSYLLPVSASALSIIFLGERGNLLELLGAMLALLGVYWIARPRAAREVQALP